MPELLEWLGVNYPLRLKLDPIPGWQKQVARLRSKGNPHTALENYVAFMEHTAQIREAYHETAAAAEREIDRLVDEYRAEKRGLRHWSFWGNVLRSLGLHVRTNKADADSEEGRLLRAEHSWRHR